MAEFLKAAQKDIPLIQDLAKKSWGAAYAEILGAYQIEYMLQKMYSASALAEQMEDADFHFFIVRNNSEICGFLSFQTDFEPDTTKLHKLYLLPKAKGGGIGKASINFVKKSLEGKNSRIILAVNKENPAKFFYESCGFSTYEETVTPIGNGYIMDDFLMEYRAL